MPRLTRTPTRADGAASIASTCGAYPTLMLTELPWNGGAFPLSELQPIPQLRGRVAVVNRAYPMGWAASHSVIRAGLDQCHDAASGRARRAGERSQHAPPRDQHGVRTTPDGGTQFVDHRQLMVDSA